MKNQHEFVIGLFSNNGKRIEKIFNVIKCSHSIASFLVGILKMSKIELPEGCWFAYDYSKSWNLNIITKF